MQNAGYGYGCVLCARVISSTVCAAISLVACCCLPKPACAHHMHVHSLHATCTSRAYGALQDALFAWYLHSYQYLSSADEEPREVFVPLIWTLQGFCRGRHAHALYAISAAHGMSRLLYLSAIVLQVPHFMWHDVPQLLLSAPCIAVRFSSSLALLWQCCCVVMISSISGNAAVVY
jgi:hypothetical protein